MNDISGITIGLSLVGLVLLVVILIALFYKPGKRLKVIADYKPNYDGKDSVLKVSVKNVGKKHLKLTAPYVKFSHHNHSKLYQIKSDKAQCTFPRVMRVGDEIGCEVELLHYKDEIDENEWHPTHVKVLVKDTVGLEFASKTLDYKL